MNTKFYKTCAVPLCNSTTITTPEKLFIHVPKDKQIRSKWLRLARRDIAALTTTSTAYFCEDHFDLPNDMENYVEYTTMGKVSRIIMKPGCLPRKFACQPDRSSASLGVGRPAMVIRQRLSLIKDCEQQEDMRIDVSHECENLSNVPSTSSDQTRDAIVSSGVSQCDQDSVVESETPQTSATALERSMNALEHIIECSYSSSTESALSDADDPSTATKYEEQNSSKNYDTYKPSTKHSATEATTTILHNEVNRIGELQFEQEVQSRANKQCTRASDEKERKDEIMEQHRCYKIVVNVYHYLKKEYEALKRQLGALYDVRAFSNILERTAAAAGVSQRTVTLALHEHRINWVIHADHNYDKGIARTSTTSSKPRNADFIVRMLSESGTRSHILNKKQVNNEINGKRVRRSKKRTIKRRVRARSKPSHEEQIPSKNRQSEGSVQSRKRQTSNNAEEHDSESMGPPKRRSTRIRDRNKPSDEEQLPFPSPIQLRVDGVMETKYKTEPADDECPPTLGDYPLESRSWSHDHREQAPTTEETDTLFETEPSDDDYLQDLKPDPLELESNATALDLEDPSDSPEVKFECVDEDMDISTDYSSIFDPTPLDIKPEPPE